LGVASPRSSARGVADGSERWLRMDPWSEKTRSTPTEPYFADVGAASAGGREEAKAAARRFAARAARAVRGGAVPAARARCVERRSGRPREADWREEEREQMEEARGSRSDSSTPSRSWVLAGSSGMVR